MHLIALDDLLIDDWNLYERPLVTDRSNRLAWSVKRRQGVAGSAFFGGQAEPARWNILFKPNDLETRDALLAVLGGDVSEERRLLAIRDDVAQTRVLTYASPLKITEHNELDISVDFEGSDSVWRSESADEITKAFSSTLDQAMHLVVPGNTLTAPRIILTPQVQRSASTTAAGWSWRRRYVVTNLADEPLYRYPVRISLGSTTAVVSGGKAQADGDDVRVIIDGIEVERTLVTWNTAASHVWFLVQSLPAGESMTVEVWYGNSAATNPPALTYPNLPAFTLSASSNALWDYPINDVAANKGLGAWWLSKATIGAVADFTIPGAWQRAATLEHPKNQDNRVQGTSYPFVDTGSWVVASYFAARMASDWYAGSDRFNAYDGVSIRNPLGITSIFCGFQVLNQNGVGVNTILMRDSSIENWSQLYAYTTAQATWTGIATATYTPSSPVKQLACAVWPLDGHIIPDGAVGMVSARWDTSLQLNIDSSKISITGGTEEQIYELATELRIGGGQDRIAPYRSLLIGNARGDAGAGVPRCGILLTQALVLDGEDHTHEVWLSDLSAKVESVSAHAIRPIVGFDSAGSTEEGPSNLLLPLAPPRNTVPNGAFEVDIGGWMADTFTSGVTATRTWDGTVGGNQLGSLKVAITANSAGIGAAANTLGARFFAINGRSSVEVTAWMQTSSANLTPRLFVRFYDGNGTEIGPVGDVDWTPVASTPYRRSFAVRAPFAAATFRIGLMAFADTAGATGNVWFDDVTINDAELIVADQAMGTLSVAVELEGRWL